MRRVLSFIFGWCFIIVCVVFSIKSTALNPDFYIPKYEEMNLASDIGVSKKDLNQSIRLLLEYLDDKRADIKGHITWYGVSQDTFNEKETSHMVDVKIQNPKNTSINMNVNMAVKKPLLKYANIHSFSFQ